MMDMIMCSPGSPSRWDLLPQLLGVVLAGRPPSGCQPLPAWPQLQKAALPKAALPGVARIHTPIRLRLFQLQSSLWGWLWQCLDLHRALDFSLLLILLLSLPSTAAIPRALPSDYTASSTLVSELASQRTNLLCMVYPHNRTRYHNKKNKL